MANIPPTLQLPQHGGDKRAGLIANRGSGTGRSMESASSGTSAVSGNPAPRPGPLASGLEVADLFLGGEADHHPVSSSLLYACSPSASFLSKGGAAGMSHLNSARYGKSRIRGSAGGKRKKKTDEIPIIKDGKDVTPQALVLPTGVHRQAQQQANSLMGSFQVSGPASGASGSSGMTLNDVPGLLRADPVGPTASSAPLLDGRSLSLGPGLRAQCSGSVFSSAEPVAVADDTEGDYISVLSPNVSEAPMLARVAVEEREAKFTPVVESPADPWTVKLEETETTTLLYIPGVRIWGDDSKLSNLVALENKRYQEMIERHKEKDKYTTKGAQTFNPTSRNKRVQKFPESTRSVLLQASNWDIEDTYEKEQSVAETDEEEGEGQDALPMRDPGTQAGADNGLGTLGVGLGLGGGPGESKLDDRSSSASSPRRDSRSHFSALGSQLSSSDKSVSYMTTASGPSEPALSMTTTQADLNEPFDKLTRQPAFVKALSVLEQAVVQNELHQEQLLYRNHPAATADARLLRRGRTRRNDTEAGEEGEDHGDSFGAAPGANGYSGAEDSDTDTDTGLDPSDDLKMGSFGSDDKKRMGTFLAPLWTFECALTKGLTVSCLAFNKLNQDLLAAGYGSVDFGHATNGLILFWSLKNPRYPHKIIKTKHSVTSLDFGSDNSNYLAAGMYDGSLMIFDLSSDLTDKPAYESTHATGKHSEAVWSVKWVAKDNNKGSLQNLLSISSDSTVQQWDMKKGLVPHELMHLKRVPNKAQFITQQTGQMEGLSRDASGLCFDFPINDGTQYFVGTEDGVIQKCSISYNEQVLENYFGHTAPVYKLRCSPFHPDVFISCSADWTCALWTQKQTHPLLRFLSGHDYIMDVDWSPSNSCAFASVSRDGRVEIWDLNHSPLDPIIQHHTTKSLSCVMFSPNSPVVFTGSKDGSIDVYRVEGVDLSDFNMSMEDQAARLADAMFEHNENKHQLGNVPSQLNTPRDD